MITGAFTALTTPFDRNGQVDDAELERLIDFQISCGITGILTAGTTGESPTLTWDEHLRVIEKTARTCRGKCQCIAGTGSNNTREALSAAKHAHEAGVDAILLVDPYYNGPSSLEIRREYVAPIARAVPDLQLIPYVIPGRTGCQLLPEDLAILARDFKNVQTVKEATGNPENMKRTRACCGKDYAILSGDDGLTLQMMTDPAIDAQGVISVTSNVAPAAVTNLVRALREGRRAEAEKLNAALEPLFNLVTVKTEEETPFGRVSCRARNPLAIKTLMAVLGMPSGGCRQPLGKMTQKGLQTVIDVARRVQSANPEILRPAAEFFHVDVDARLNDPKNWADLAYSDY